MNCYSLSRSWKLKIDGNDYEDANQGRKLQLQTKSLQNIAGRQLKAVFFEFIPEITFRNSE